MSASGHPGPVSDAVLYEGYLLYPYDPGSLKNRYRSLFGTLFPEEYCRTHRSGDMSTMRLECIAAAGGGAGSSLSVRLRFLQLGEDGGAVRDVCPGEVSLESLAQAPVRSAFAFSPVSGELRIEALAAGAGTMRVAVEVANLTPLPAASERGREEAARFALASPHLVLSLTGASFVSAIDPPENHRAAVASCRSQGTWPALLGPPGSSDTLLAAPIILPDHPEIAPESPGDFFDGTEVDELLTLRILTLTDDEKERITRADGRARELLERTELLGLERLASLHGAIRLPALRPGARVRLHPRAGSDIMDLALEGRSATVVAIEHDIEGRSYIVVTVDDDPGRDLGPFAHRFFFRPDEVGPV